VFIGRNYQTQINYSEKKAGEIDDEVNKIVTNCYKNGTKIIKEYLKELNIMAEVLIEKETLYKDEIDMIMSGKSKEQVIKIMDEKEQRTKEKVELERAQSDYERAQKEQNVRVKTAEALKNAGMIEEVELAKIREEAEKIIAAAKEKYDKLTAAKETQKTTEPTAVTAEKTVETKENQSAVKRVTEKMKKQAASSSDNKKTDKPDKNNK
jgi:hypothetical protein